MFSYTCTQSCCNLPNNPHNGKTIQSNALLVISIFMMLNMEGKRKYFRQVSTLLLYDMIFARSFNNSFVYYFGNLSYEYTRIKTKAFCSICSRSNIMYISLTCPYWWFRKCYEKYFSTSIQLPYRIWYTNLQVLK